MYFPPTNVITAKNLFAAKKINLPLKNNILPEIDDLEPLHVESGDLQVRQLLGLGGLGRQLLLWHGQLHHPLHQRQRQDSLGQTDQSIHLSESGTFFPRHPDPTIRQA